METLISILIAIIGGLGFALFHKSKQNTQLKADKDLTSQEESSKLVDEKITDSQKDIAKLEEQKNKPVGDDFWKDYTNPKK